VTLPDCEADHSPPSSAHDFHNQSSCHDAKINTRGKFTSTLEVAAFGYHVFEMERINADFFLLERPNLFVICNTFSKWWEG
jgi:hypothetical protein